jgi:predicted secreted protein
MSWVTGIAVYVMIWWTVIFAVLPIGAHPDSRPDPRSGWRGAPATPALWKKALVTTAVAAVLWVVVWWVVQSPYLSFRHGWLALPSN